ncbi:MAG: G5 domain-containing protein, partial [Anaerolineales bacterium]|nr:G5 domain-containing protein [Anaerolineales bacterium]
MMGVVVSADEQSVNVQVPAGSTVQQALDKAGLALGTLDRVEPPSYTLLTNGATIRVIRVEEEFTVEQEIIPFERKILQTESLPDQEKLLAQSGENGLQEITYRHVFEDGVEVSKRSVKYVVVKEAVPEVVMVGIQTPFTQVSIPGRLVYLLGGNAWMMEQTTANRRPLINSGDLDGRVFELSSDGNLLLFTRNSADEEEINTLWAAEITEDPLELIDLGVSNIIHFADWLPGSNSKIVFSTVEPRSTAPGWQANNDLYALSFSPTGWVSNWQEKPVLEPNSGGVYGWWGMDFVWSPDGEKLAYARPDSVGVLDFNDGVLTPTLEIAPLQTGGDWAWIPGVSWDPYGNLLYTVNHEPPEDSQQFDV